MINLRETGLEVIARLRRSQRLNRSEERRVRERV